VDLTGHRGSPNLDRATLDGVKGLSR
jgi:hypothetical protein